MKKILKKSLALSLAALSAVSVVGCTKKAAPNTPADIEIMYWESGLGRDYMDKLIEAFEEKYPHYSVTLEATADSGFLGTKLPLGAEYNTTDIFMSVVTDSIRDNECVELTKDVYEYKHKGESKTIGEKLGQSSFDAIKYQDGNIRYIPYGGNVMGMTYNADIIDGSNYVLPKTTDELIQLAEDLSKAGTTPFIHFTGGGYWMDMVDLWAGQYDTMNGLHDLFENPTLDKLTTKEGGYYHALQVLEKLIGNNNYIYKGSNTLNFTDAQTYYLENKAAMMVNGGWMEYEMSGNYEMGEKNFSMMKTPIISSIIDKCPSIENDTELAAVVEAVDFGLTALEGAAYSVSQEDFDRVKEARSYLNYNALGHAMCIPNYSNAVEASIEFVRFYYSDEAIKIFEDTTNTRHPGVYAGENLTDRTDFSRWANDLYELRDSATLFTATTRAESGIFLVGASWYGAQDVVQVLSAANKADRLTADTLWTKIQAKHQKDWAQYWANAGTTPPEN